MTVSGIDVSSFQHPNNAAINWSQVYAAGYRFVFVKLTEGTTYVNPYGVQDIKDATAAGLLAGGYHFFHPGQDANQQVQDFINSYPGLQVHAIDEEVTDNLTWPQIAADTETALNDLGARSVLYTNLTYLQNMTGSPWGHPLWYARPGLSAPDHACDFWQYGTGAVPGIQGTTDLNQWMGSLAGLQAFFNTQQGDGMAVTIVTVTGAGQYAWYESCGVMIPIDNPTDSQAFAGQPGSTGITISQTQFQLWEAALAPSSQKLVASGSLSVGGSVNVT